MRGPSPNTEKRGHPPVRDPSPITEERGQPLLRGPSSNTEETLKVPHPLLRRGDAHG